MRRAICAACGLLLACITLATTACDNGSGAPDAATSQPEKTAQETAAQDTAAQPEPKAPTDTAQPVPKTPSEAAQPDTATAPDAAPPPEDPALVEAGKTVLKNLKPLKPGESASSYFEVKMGPTDVVGYVIATLEGTGTADDPGYRYAVETLNKYPTGASALTNVDGKFTSSFEPIEVELRQTLSTPVGETQVTVQRAIVGSDKIQLYASRGGEEGKLDVPRPEEPFFYGIEMLAQRLDLSKEYRFIAGELDLSSGRGRRLIISRATLPDGLPMVHTQTTGGTGSYQFWFDKEGNLIRWGEPSMPLIFVSTTKQRVDAVKKALKAGATP